MTSVPTDDEFDAHTVKLPYAGTSGRGGSRASASARAAEDASGITGARQRQVMGLLANAGPMGMTWTELSAKGVGHHGQVTGALSMLHKAGDIARLAIGKRASNSVYVTPEHVNGRAVAEHGGRKEPAPIDLGNAPVLSVEEAEFLDGFRHALARHPQDKPLITLRITSARQLLELLDRTLR